MGVVPTKDVDAVQFFEDHLPVWQANAVSIGLQASQITSMATLVTAARKAIGDQSVAKQAAKNATVALRDAVGAMRSDGSDLIKTIKAFAATTNDPAVYTKAEIPPPASPSPAPPPGQPTNFKVELTPSGALVLSWKAVNAAASSGVYFSVRRKLNGDSAFTLVGNTGGKSFVDDTLVQGSTGATYIVQGFRGTNPGPESDQLSVQFGVGGSGLSRTLNIAA